MHKLKKLKEALGALRKERDEKVKNRASKIEELDALNKDPNNFSQEKYDGIKKEIEQIDGRLEQIDDEIDMKREQINLEKSTPDDGNEVPFMDEGSEPSNEEKELGRYSFVKAFREMMDSGDLTGLEKEMQQDAIKNNENREGNLHIPQKVMVAPSAYNRYMNDLTVDGGTGGDQGGLTVETDKRTLIDILKAKLPFTMGGSGGLGATMFSNLNGDVEFPRAIEDSNDPATKAESAAADEQSPTFGSLNLSPTRLPTFTEVTRKLLRQSSTDIEVWLRNYLMYKLSKKMSIDIIDHILNNGSVNVVEMGTDGAAPTWAKIVEFETKISSDDADEPSMGWLVNPKVRGKLKTTEKTSNTAVYLWGNDGMVNNYQAIVSTLVPSNLNKGATSDNSLSAALFGNWGSLYIGQWGGFDFLVNPFSRDTEGIIRINAWTFFDQGLRHPEAFAVSKDIDTD